MRTAADIWSDESGDDYDTDEELAKVTSSTTSRLKKKGEVAAPLDPEEEKLKMKKKMERAAEKKRKKEEKAARKAQRKKEKRLKREQRKKASSETGQPKDKKAGYESGDSYDSGDNLVRNVDDDNFLDLDDDDEDLLKEYNEDQNFNDERGVGSSKAKKGKKRSAGGGEKLSGARASDMDNPVMQAMSRMKRQKVKEKSVEELEQSAIEFVTLMDTIADTDEKSNTGQTKPKEAQKKMENQSDSSSVVSSESEDESDEESVVQQPKNNKQTNKKEKATPANPAGKNKTKTSSETTTSTRTSTSTSTSTTTTTTTTNNNNNTHSLIRLPLHLATHNPVPPSFPPVSNLPFPSTVDSTRYEISTGLVVPSKSSLPVTSPRGHSALVEKLRKHMKDTESILLSSQLSAYHSNPNSDSDAQKALEPIRDLGLSILASQRRFIKEVFDNRLGTPSRLEYFVKDKNEGKKKTTCESRLRYAYTRRPTYTVGGGGKKETNWKRGTNPYFVFLNERMNEMKGKDGYNYKKLQKESARIWKAMNLEERRPYEEENERIYRKEKEGGAVTEE